MFNIEVTSEGDLDSVLMLALGQDEARFSRANEAIREVVIREMDRMARSGVGSDGVPLRRILPTSHDRNVRRYGHASENTPLHPRLLESRTATGRDVFVVAGDESITITIDWSGAPWVVLHGRGRARGGVVRDVRLPDPAGLRAIREVALRESGFAERARGDWARRLARALGGWSTT